MGVGRGGWARGPSGFRRLQRAEQGGAPTPSPAPTHTHSQPGWKPPRDNRPTALALTTQNNLLFHFASRFSCSATVIFFFIHPQTPPPPRLCAHPDVWKVDSEWS